MAEKKDLEAGDPELECIRKPMQLPVLPKPLTLEEKKYLLAVERGDMGYVRRTLQIAHRKKHIDSNCVDSLGRGALTLSIDGENLEMVELLVIMGVETKDALLQAINAEFVEAVELLLEHEELIYKDGEPYSWQKVDPNTAMFTPDITPLMLAAHKNNYEIIKILLDRGATLPNPHDVRCGCEECIRESTEDSLRHSLARLNEYRALASPSLIALSSTDPILTAFELSWELRNLAFAEQESKAEYLELRRQAQIFAVDLLDQSRSSQELAIILNHDPEEPAFVDGEHMKLARLELAIDFKQKKFVAHPNIQQLLASIWYEGVPGFRRKTTMEKIMIICRVALLFPFYCTLYMIAPNCATGKLMRKPFMKFLIHASSYLFFLLILILVSQRAEVQAIQLFGPDWMVQELEKELLKQRGNGPTYLELVVVVYVLGFIWEETQEIYIEGIRSYLRNMWNFIDFTRNSLYVAVALLRFAAYLQQSSEIRRDPQTKFIPRESWDAFDPQLIAEGLFAAANIFSALKLVHLFSINPHLGPLQISLGRMVIDIVKFFFIYSLVLFAFACGLNQLLWYFADLEKRKCYVLPGGLPDWDNAGDSCMKWRSFGNAMGEAQFGVRHMIGAPVAITRLSEQPLVCIPPRTAKFTLAEWKASNEQRCRNAEDQQQLADRVLGESERIREETAERAEIMKATSDRRIEERIGDIEYNKKELQIQRREICIELEALGVYKTRLLDCLASLQSNALTICRKCLMLRDGRIGIDLVVDEAEHALQQEITTILGGQSLLKRVLEQLNEQMRRLRSTRYLLDRDLQYKQVAIDLDKGSLSLKPTDLCLSIYEGYASLDPANISADEYNAYSAKNIQLAAREVTSARPIRMFVDTILKQVIDDLWSAYNKCNHAFHERIEETKRAKAKLEDMHRDTTQKISDMQDNILQLQKALSAKEGNTALAHTRLGRRAQRTGAELVRDPPGQALYYECEMLRHSTEQLQQMLQEASASLRYLLQTQIQLEEDINVKMNTLKIDEVDCMTLRETMDYHAVFEASQSLFWASFGMVGLENFELAGIKSYTRFWGLLMFGSYSVINVIVLLNLLIAMMSNSYAMIDEHSDVEWKFARTRLWMSYFEESATLPPPFNILPTPKLFLKMLGLRKKDKLRKMKLKEQKEKEHDVRYTAVMRALVWRYVSAMHRKMDDEPVTEDDINELKGDVSALRYELLEVFERNGMDVSFTDRKEKTVLGSKQKVWERRLMKDFHIAVAGVEEDKPVNEDGLSRFRRIAKMAIASTTSDKWDQTLASAGVSSQIGRCRSRESFKNQQNLQRAMEEARKLVLRSPLPASRVESPIEMPVTPGHTLLELIKDISTEVGEPVDISTLAPKSPTKPAATGGVVGIAVGGLLTASAATSRPITPKPRSPSPAPTKPPSKSSSPVPPSEGPSSVPNASSPVAGETASPVPEPSPLKSKRVPGESPPKVIKRKPSGPQPDDVKTSDEGVETEAKITEDISVARPVAPEIKPSEGAIPPPPAPTKPKAPAAPTMEVTPSTPPVRAPTPTSDASTTKPPSPPKSTTPMRVASPQPSISAAVARPATPPSPEKRLSSTSSTEQLIPPASPEPLRSIKKIDEVKTIKRQQKSGWL